MRTFVDNSGRNWTVSLDAERAVRLRRSLGVDLLDGLEGSALVRLITEPKLLGRVLYRLCEAEALVGGVGPEDFAAGVEGEAATGATVALLEEWVEFLKRG